MSQRQCPECGKMVDTEMVAVVVSGSDTTQPTDAAYSTATYERYEPHREYGGWRPCGHSGARVRIRDNHKTFRR